jgi:hypothetical protein
MRLDLFTECFTESFRECFFRGCWEFFLLVLGLAVFVVVFEVILGCPLWVRGPQDAGAGVVKWEIVRFVVYRLAPADFRSVASLAPFSTTPILDRWTLINGRRLSGSW